MKALTNIYRKANSPLLNVGGRCVGLLATLIASSVAISTPSFAQSAPPQNGLAVWLKADAGVAYDSITGRVNQWSDQSASGNNAYQGSSGNQPTYVSARTDLNGKPVLRFDGGSSFLDVPDNASLQPANAVTVIAVSQTHGNWQQDIVARALTYNYYGAWALPPLYTYGLGLQNNNVERGYLGFGSGASNWQSDLAGSTARAQRMSIATMVYDGTTENIYDSGALQGSNVVTANLNYDGGQHDLLIGAHTAYWGITGYFYGDMAEVLVYNRALTPAEQQQIEVYLADKYGLYHPNATWPTSATNNYSAAVQAEIIRNQWNKAQADAYVAFLATNPAVPATGLVSWLKADDSVTSDPTTGKVSAWGDQSFYQNSASQGSVGNQPTLVASRSDLNNKPVVRFDGGSSFLDIADNPSLKPANAVTVIALAQNAGGGQQDIVSHGLSYNYYGAWSLAPLYGYDLGVQANNVERGYIGFGSGASNWYADLSGATARPARASISTMIYDGANLNIYDSGASQATQGIAGPLNYDGTNLHDLIIGANSTWNGITNYFHGDVGEVLVYNRALTPQEQQQAEVYLADKYGVYHPNANWPKAYSTAVQAEINRNQWNKNQADTYATFVASSPVPASGLAVWLKADAGVSSDPTTGHVSQWSDQSPTGNHAYQGSDGNCPTLVSTRTDLNGKPVLRFDGGNSFLDVPDNVSLKPSTAVTIIAVAQTNSSAQQDIVSHPLTCNYYGAWALAPIYSYALGVQGNNLEHGYVGFGDGASNWYADLSGPTRFQQMSISTLVYDGNTLNLYDNGGVQASQGISGPINYDGTTPHDLLIGARVAYYGGVTSFFSGDMAEVLVYNRALTPQEQEQAEVYLADKYGLYRANATWPRNYSVAVQSEINRNRWNKSQADAYAAYLATYPALPPTGLTMWFKSDQVQATGGTVSTWMDQGPFHHDAAQGNGVLQPALVPGAINGLPVLRFNNNFLTIPDSPTLRPNQYTIFAIAKENSTATYQTLLCRQYQESGAWNYPYVTFIVDPFGVNGGNYVRSAVATDQGLFEANNGNKYDLSQFHALEWKFDGVNQYLYSDTNLVGVVASPGNLNYGGGPANLTIGTRSDLATGENLYADVAELIVYNRALTDFEKRQVETYLAERYNFAIPAPQISINGGIYSQGPQVTISSVRTDAVIHYTTDGSDPTTSSTSQIYTGPFTPPSGSVVTASVTEPGITNSSPTTVSTPFQVDPQAVFNRSSLVMWYRGDYGIGIDGSGNVTSWNDASGLPTGYQAGQGNSSLAPALIASGLNGKPALRFNGNGQFEQLNQPMPDLTDLTIFAVVNPSGNYGAIFCDSDQAGGQDMWLALDSGNAVIRADKQSTQLADGYGNRGGIAVPWGLDTSNQPRVISWTVSAGQSSVYREGNLLQTFNLTASEVGYHSANPTIGCWWDQGARESYFDGDLAEFMVFNQSLSDQDRQAVESYLLNRYAMATQVGIPVLSQAPGNYLGNVPLTISDATPGASIYYTLDGTDPTPSSTLYQYPITVESTQTVKAKAFKTGLTPSAVAGGIYTIGLPAGNGNGLAGQYYSNTNLSGDPVLIRVDPTINFNWSGTPPDPSIAHDYYSVRWTGYVIPQYSETYTFYTDSDDGPRLIVNGQDMIEQFHGQGETWYSASIYLKAGQAYPIELDYQQQNGPAVARLLWSSPSTPQQIIPQSQLASGLLNPVTVTPPVASSPGGAFTMPLTVSLSTSTPGATIVYTTDGSLPTHTSTVYSTPLPISTNTTLRALAFLAGDNDSPPITRTFTFDTSGPTLGTLQLNGANFANNATITTNGTFSIAASDPQGVSRVDFLVDNALIGSGSNSYSVNVNLASLTDGAHVLIINAYDSLGNVTTQTVDFTVQEAAPPAPNLTSPSNNFVSGSSPITVKGTATPGTTITFYNNGQPLAATVLASADGTFQGSVGLSNGNNSIQATATNPGGRGGEGPRSPAMAVTLNTAIPSAPTAFHATTLAGGAIQLSWGALTPGTVTGYNIYRSTSPFTDPSQGTKINSSLITSAQYTDLPSSDGTYYYLVTAVSTAGIEGVVSQQQTTASDRTPPEAVSILYAPQGNHDATTGAMAPGIVNVTVTMSEPLQTAPFLSLTPAGGYPISITLQADPTSNVRYTGSFALQSTTPTGTATAVLSAVDLAGNRGTKIDAGGTALFDTTGPTVTALLVSPSTAIQNSASNPVQVQVTVTLDKPVKDGTTPVVGYTLSSNPGNALTFSNVVAGSDNLTWIATTTLPASAGSTTENMSLTYSGVDYLGNAGTAISVPHQFQVYQGNLPGLAAPFGLAATPQPGGKIQLQWQSVTSASDYQLYRQGPSDSTLLPLALSGGAVTYLDQTQADGTYSYTVASVRSLNSQTSTGTQSGPVNALAQSQPPLAPQSLAASLAGYGVVLQWQAPNNLNENVTYALYRSANPITSLNGLTPIATGITAITAADAQPDPSKPNYAVAAVDAAGNISAPSNSAYLDTQLLPVSSLNITQSDTNPPVISWSAVPGNISGYNIYLGPSASLQQINSSLLTTTSYTDTGYTNNERQYTLVTVDNSNHSSVGHSLTLPILSATLDPNAVVRRGLINDLIYTVTNSSAEAISNIDVRVAINGKSDVSPTFSLQPGQSQQVMVVVGGDADLPQESAPIQTSIEITPHAGELVSIQRSGTVPVVDGALAVSVLPSNFTRGGTGSVQFSLTNPSSEPVEIIVARNQGQSASDQIRIKVMDANNVVYSTTPVKFNVGTNVITLSDGNTVLQIPPGATVTSAAQLVSVPDNVPDNAYVQLQIDQVYFDEGQADQVVLSGLTSRQAVNVVATSYFVTVTSVSPATSNGTQPVLISGTATFRVTNTPAPNQPVVLHVDNAGFDLSYQLATDSNGNFSYSFTPPPGTLGGVYTVWAVNPQITDRTVQQTFTIQQIGVSPATINLSAPRNYAQTVNFTAKAGPGTTATNIHFTYVAADQPGGQFPTGITVDTSHSVESLAQNASATLPISITGDSTVTTGSVVLRLRSDNDQGQPWQTVQVNYTFADAVPALRWDSYSSTAGVNPGNTVTSNLTLTNQGLAASNNVTFQVLNQADGTLAPSWVSLGSAPSVSQVKVGDNVPVSVNFSPPASQAQGDYAFIIRASAPNQPNQDSVVGLTISASGNGNARFQATDIYTGTQAKDAQGNPLFDAQNNPVIVQGLTGATITLQNDDVASINYTMTTDANGEADFSGITVGHYQYHASAPGHDSVNGGIWIQPGTTTSQTVNMQNDLVSVNWQVTPTTIQDRYDITINATFQTDVPAAVVTVDPGTVNLPPLQAGDVYNGQFTFTNHGLIDANNMQFSLPPDDGNLHYELQGAMPSTIGAGQSVTLPYRITCIQSFPTAVQVAVVGGASGTLVASLGLLAFGWAGRRSLYRLGTIGIICSLAVLTLALPKRAYAQTATSDCYHYMTGCAAVGSFQCTNKTWYPITVKIVFAYIINNCPSQATAPSSVYVNSSPSGNASNGGGGTAYAPSPVTGGGKDCVPKCPDGCDKDKQTQSSINLPEREYRDDATDLSVKVPGGTASVSRYFYYNAWHWRDLSEGLTLNAGAGGIASIDYITENYPVVDSGFTTYEQGVTHARIIASSTGYRWQSTTGQWKTFDSTGKLLATGNRNLTLTQLQYDSSGNLTSVSDANGNVIFAVTSSGGQISAVQDWAGRTVRYGYGGGNLTSITDAAGNSASYSYDGNGHITNKTDVNGNTFTITYDNGGYVSSEVDSKGNGWFFTFSYDQGLQQYYAQIKSSAGKIEEKTYASDGTLILDLLNGVQQKKVLRSGSVWSITQANGSSIQETYDEFNNLTKEVRPEGTTTYQYEPTYSQPTQITYPDGTVTSMSYDTSGNLTSKTEAAGTSVARTTSYRYDSLNELTEKTDARGNKTDYAYDGKGNLVREYDPSNTSMQVTYTYDSAGNRLTRTDALGNTTRYTYDGLGRVTTETDALGNETINTYRGNLISQVEVGHTASASGRMTKFVYDQQGRRTQVIRVGNGGQQVQQTTTYDGDGNVVSQANALGQATNYRYDQNGWPLAVTQPYGASGSTSSKTYNNDGSVQSETDPVGVVTQYTYDASGRVVTRTEALGTQQQRSVNYAYDAMNRVTKVTYSDGSQTFTTNYGYDALGRRTSVSGQREYPKTDAYDANDNLVSETDARGFTTRYVYDAYNRRTQVNAPGQTSSFAYDLDGNLLSVTDGNNISRAYAYDALNRQVAQSVPMQGLPSGWASTPAQVLSSSTYDAWGEVVATSDAGGGETSATYDDLGRAIDRVSAAGLTLHYSYNALDQVTSIAFPATNGNSPGSSVSYVYNSTNGQLLDSVTDRAGNTTRYQYDARLLKTQETASNGAVTQYVYDPLGRLAMQTDALGNGTLWGYDQFDEVTQMVYPDSTPQVPRVATYAYDGFGKLQSQGGTGQYPVTYGYDAAGNRVSLTDGNNSQTQWGYDGLNRVTSKTYADNSTYHYSYDPAGNLAARVDALGRTTQYRYNAYNLVAQVVYPTDPSVSFQYDALGRRTQMSDGSGTTTWAWDSANQNTGYSQSAVGQSISYAYDAENHRTQMVAGASSGVGVAWTTTYGYDGAGRLISLLDNRASATSPFTYAYQAGTNWISGHANADGSASLNQYDVLGRLTRVTAANGAGSAINTYAYNYDAVGQRTQEASTVGTRNFGYDNLRQLTSAYRVDGSGNPQPNYNFSYAFDAIGNWTKSTSAAGETDFTANHLNQYTGISGGTFAQPATPQYDADGNMTSDGTGNTYVYDEENRLVEVDTPNNASIAKTVSVYDGLSRRVEKRTYSPGGTLLATTRYLYDGLVPVAEYDSSNSLTVSYTRGLDLSGTMQGAGGIGGLLALTQAAGNSYSYFADGNGNIVDLTDAYGASAAHYEYDPFGNIVAQTGTLQQSYQWSSKEADAGTGLVYYLYRFYNVGSGRWLNRDPKREHGGLNLYLYCRNNPINYGDEIGLDYEYLPALENLSDFVSGAADNLSFGLTRQAREGINWMIYNDYSDAGVDSNSNYYVAGEVTETTVEITVTLGGGALRYAAKNTVRSVVEGGARGQFRRAFNLKGGVVHHLNQIKGGRYPLPFKWSARGYWNMRWLPSRTAHLAAHARITRLEALDELREQTMFQRFFVNQLGLYVNNLSNQMNVCNWSVDVDTKVNSEVEIYEDKPPFALIEGDASESYHDP